MSGKRTTGFPTRLTLVFACLWAAGPLLGDEVAPAWGEAVEGVQVRLRADKTVWMFDKVPTFQLDVRNNGKAQCSFSSTPEGSCEVEFDGRWYTAATRDARTASVWLLKPGEEMAEALEIPLGKSWVAESTGKSPNPGLGKHTVRVRFHTLRPTVLAITNPVEITIEQALPGSRLSIEEAAADLDFAFAAACEAATGVAEPESDLGTFHSPQDFKAVETLAGTPLDGQALRLHFARVNMPRIRERPIAMGERVIWFVSRPRKDAPDQWRGTKAVSDTPENRKAVIDAVQKEAYWGPVSNGLQCRLLPAEQTVEVAEGAKPGDINVYVTCELRNVGEKVVKFLPWYTPLEKELTGDIFDVVGPDGGKAGYLGMHVDRGLPQGDQFMTLLRGRMASNRIRLPYDFTKLGAYRISFSSAPRADWGNFVLRKYYDDNAVDIIDNADNVWTGTLKSSAVTVRIVRPHHAPRPPAAEEPGEAP